MATKKISELPLINALSGSQNGGSVVPVVVNGTTSQISAENFSKFVNAYNATTGSNTFIGNQTVKGNMSVSGILTVNQFYALYETASVIYSSGSNTFGDQLTDNHQMTGSITVTGSLVLNGTPLGLGQINSFTQSQAGVNTGVSVVTSSLNQFTASQDSRNFVISQYTASTNAHIVGISNFTSSNFDTMARVYQTTSSLQSTTASLNSFTSSTNAHIVGISAFTSSNFDTMARVYQTTSSLQSTTASLNAFTASQDSRNFVISQYTASTDAHIVGISQFTSSILAQNSGVASVTASLNAFTASQDNRNFIISQYTSSTDAHIVGISAFTSSQLAVNLGNSIFTASVNSHIVNIATYTSSNDSVIARIEQATASLNNISGSLIGITNGLMAFTASLDNTYATDAQLYQLYQATRSLELNSGSLIGITNGLMAYTASNDSFKTLVRSEINGIEAFTASLLSMTIVSSSAQITELAGIMAVTQSMKAATIVSSSTQIQNYNLFALTSSINTFYNKQIISGGLDVSNGITGSLKGNITGNAGTATTVLINNSSTNIDFAIPFVTAGSNGYLTPATDAVGGMLYNPSTNKLTITGSLIVSASGTPSITLYGTQQVTGSINASGSINITGSITIASGSITMPDRPAFRITGTGGGKNAPSVISGSYTTTDFNQGNVWDSTTGTFTAPIAGLYQINLTARTNSNTSPQSTQVIVYKNNTITSPSPDGTALIMVEWAANTTANHIGGSTIAKLVVGDTLKAIIAVGTASFDGNDNFSAAYIG